MTLKFGIASDLVNSPAPVASLIGDTTEGAIKIRGGNRGVWAWSSVDGVAYMCSTYELMSSRPSFIQQRWLKGFLY